MEKLILLKFRHGDFQQGFEVIVRIGSEAEVEGKFPPAPHIPEIYEDWRSDYRGLDSFIRGRIGDGKVINSSVLKRKCHQSATALRQSIRDWLTSENKDLQRIREILIRSLLNKQEEIRVIIQSEDPLLRQIPWQEWDIFNDNTQIEIALSTLNYQRVENRIILRDNKNKVRILAILGNSDGINVEIDRQILESLPNAETVFLVEPQRSELTDSLWQQNWDIIFFAGHSSSRGEKGRIYINKTDRLTIENLQYGLRRAIERGLKIAIFNSCDGLKLASALENLHIPQIIVMREQVPDKFAQEFLKYFLAAYAGGESLYLAVRSAREKLYDQGLESEFPGVTWFPVICQNPAEKSLIWQELAGGKLQPDSNEIQRNTKEKATINKEKNMINKDYVIERFRTEGGLDFFLLDRQESSQIQSQIMAVIYEQFKAMQMLGIITQFQSQPNEVNKSVLLTLLEQQISQNEIFTNKLIVFFQQIDAEKRVVSDNHLVTINTQNTEVNAVKNIKVSGGTVSFGPINQSGIGNNPNG